MGRMYIVNHWNDAAAYSGEQIGDRLKDSTALHFNRDGSANVELYSEETALAKKKSSVSIEDRILPQAKRVRVLTEQLIELESERKAGMSVEKYSHLRDILICKRQRAEVLLQKALNVKPDPTPSDEEDNTYYDEQYAETSGENPAQNVMADESVPIWLQGVSSTNSLKNPLIKACKAIRKAVQLSQAARNYYLTLKAL